MVASGQAVEVLAVAADRLMAALSWGCDRWQKEHKRHEEPSTRRADTGSPEGHEDGAAKAAGRVRGEDRQEKLGLGAVALGRGSLSDLVLDGTPELCSKRALL